VLCAWWTVQAVLNILGEERAWRVALDIAMLVLAPALACFWFAVLRRRRQLESDQS
jgi:hypothetical protein